MSPHEGKKHKHKVNNISLRQGAVFVLPANSCAAKNLQWSQNVPVFELKVCYSRKQRFLARITKFSQVLHSYFPEDYCNVDTPAIIPSQIHAPHHSTGRGSKQIELLRSNSSRLAEYLAINIKIILGN